MFNRDLFKAQVKAAGISQKELAEKLGMDESTLYRKIQDNGRFSRQEINLMLEILNIEDPHSIFFAETLA